MALHYLYCHRNPEAQAAEIDRRLATLDEDIKHGPDAFEALAELEARDTP